MCDLRFYEEWRKKHEEKKLNGLIMITMKVIQYPIRLKPAPHDKTFFTVNICWQKNTLRYWYIDTLRYWKVIVALCTEETAKKPAKPKVRSASEGTEMENSNLKKRSGRCSETSEVRKGSQALKLCYVVKNLPTHRLSVCRVECETVE